MKLINRAGLAAAAALIAAPAFAGDTFVRMVSGPSGGSWYPLGAKIMQVMEENIDGIATSNTSGGGISNVLVGQRRRRRDRVLLRPHGRERVQRGRQVLQAAARTCATSRRFTARCSRSRCARTATSRASTDMADRTSRPAKAKWTGTAFAESILNAYGITSTPSRRTAARCTTSAIPSRVALMKDGHIDVFMAATNMPQASFLELEQSPASGSSACPRRSSRRSSPPTRAIIPGDHAGRRL